MPLTRQSRVIMAELATDPEWFPTVLARIACGDRWTDICSEYCVTLGIALAWIRDEAHPERQRAYERAMQINAEVRAHEALVIADTPEMGIETKTKGDGTIETTEGDMLGHRKLQIDTRLKLASKWDRQRYGEEKQYGDGGGVTVVIQKFADEKVVVGTGGETLTVQ